MYPFYLRDKQNGVSDEELFEILEAFFISLNYDTDLYTGMQLGDNGQSLVLGGFDLNGNYMYNELSEKCMRASLELNLIDPKINLRVGKKTPDEVFVLGTRLTQKGLGFPQYSNDDVVIPGLIKLGYEPEDAADYVVAACWEFLIQKKSFENPNAATMNFPLMVSRALSKHLKECKTFLEFLECVKEEIKLECDAIVEKYIDWPMSPPSNGMISLYYKSSIDNLTDVFHHSTKYRNWGCHGAGIANAADALAAVKKAIFEDKKYSADELLAALNDDFCGHEEMRNYLRSCPKMGNNDDYVDSLAIEIMDFFQKNLNGRPVAGKGIWRAGTGASLEYISEGEKCPATADGRKAKEPFAASFSPSLDVKPSGVLSVIQSFTKYDMTNIINGGPLTLEIHENLLRNEMGIEKVASLVKTYVELGGHQLQLNSINRETLIDAQKHPEKYPNLIVRVWGWSGYFNELHKMYQDHIIRRFEY
jgi:formate C-acetyltransferase